MKLTALECKMDLRDVEDIACNWKHEKRDRQESLEHLNIPQLVLSGIQSFLNQKNYCDTKILINLAKKHLHVPIAESEIKKVEICFFQFIGLHYPENSHNNVPIARNCLEIPCKHVSNEVLAIFCRSHPWKYWIKSSLVSFYQVFFSLSVYSINGMGSPLEI